MLIRSLSVALATLGILAAQEPPSFTYPQLLDRLVDVDWLWQPPQPGERCVQFSSYDRRSHAGPGDFDAWYANRDRGQYLRVEEKDGKKEYVMVDATGPGVLARIWSANPSGELYFDVDGQRVWTVDFQDLTSGKVGPVGEPLAGVRSRGWNCHLPIPFGKHLKVAASKGDFYYQCNVVSFPAGTKVPSFAPALLETFADEIARCARNVDEPDPTERYRGRAPRQLKVPPGKLIREISIQLPYRPGVDVGAVLRNVILRVATPTEELVRVPLLDFFVTGSEVAAWRSARLDVWNGTLQDEQGGEHGKAVRLRSRWPMPLPQGGVAELIADGDVQGVDLSGWSVVMENLPWSAKDPLLFRASYHQKKNFASRPFHDFLMIDAKGGPGRFVGCSLLVKNPHRGWWGEGDEKFFVDGEDFPSTFGTGTEDYFGYAWCSPELFQSAFHAQTQCDGPGNYGFSALHRTQILDAVPFQQSFRFDLEAWHWVEKLEMDYASVVYWYGAPGASSGLPPVPPAAERTLDRLPPPPIFVADNAIEGEGLRVVECTGGTHEVQELDSPAMTFSRDQHRWWRDGKPGDVLVLAVPVPAAGRYRVTGAFCMANDYGIVELSLAGQPLGGPFDGYAVRVSGSGPREIGTVDLAAGEALLRVAIKGRNEKAVPKHMFGLDYLRLEPVR